MHIEAGVVSGAKMVLGYGYGLTGGCLGVEVRKIRFGENFPRELG